MYAETYKESTTAKTIGIGSVLPLFKANSMLENATCRIPCSSVYIGGL